jgi:hypothetical protein
MSRTPDFRALRNETDNTDFHQFSFASFMHPNPRIYKYYWWVFWEGSPCDGDRFLTDRYRLPTEQAFGLIELLVAGRKSHWLYNTRIPRDDPDNTPFDPNADKWRGMEWAKSFEEDTDGEYNGFK